MKFRKGLKLRPAPPVVQYQPLRAVESAARDMFYVQKVFVTHGDAAALEALQQVTQRRPDPSDASMTADSVMLSADASLLSWEGSQRGRSDGGRSAGEAKKEAAKSTYAKIMRYASQMLAGNSEPREIAGLICDEYGYSKPRVYRALRDHPAGHWPDKRHKKTTK